MNKQTARSLLMDFLYDEISAEEEEKLKSYLDNHPGFFEELKGLRKMQKLLGKMPEPEAPQKLHIVEPRRSIGMWWNEAKAALPRSGLGKASLAAAVCLLFLLIAASVANLQINSYKSGFSLSLGYGNQADRSVIEKNEKRPSAHKQEKNLVQAAQYKNVVTAKEAGKFLTSDEAEVLLAKIQQQNKALLAAFVKKMNKQDQKQLKRLVQYFQARRLYNLKRIKQSQLVNAYRWQQTNQVLSKIIQTASVEN